MTTISSDLVWTIVSFVLTLMVFSYLFGDNLVFRFVSALFVGVTSGYFFIILVFQVLLPRLIAPLAAGSMIALVPLVASGLLLLKLSPRLAKFGNLPMAYLVGTGAAVAVGGAVLGTLFGQIKGALSAFTLARSSGQGSTTLALLEGGFMLLGTVATLIYFQFGAKHRRSETPKRGWFTAIFAWIGQLFIAITLGSVFAGVLTTAVTALLERSDFILTAIKTFFHLT